MKHITIIGGGLAGLVASILLSRNGCKVFLIEKHDYPRHKVCGEYISMEVYSFLQKENLLPGIPMPFITKLVLSSNKGSSFSTNLTSGGFGLSRYTFEEFLYNQALNSGVKVVIDEALDIIDNGKFQVKLKNGTTIESDLLLCAYGKRNKFDRSFERAFFFKRSPYVGIKFHAKAPNHSADVIALHNFQGGYCGICNVENDMTNFCYLVHRDVLKSVGGIESLHEEKLKQNILLRAALESSEMIYEKPLVINEVSFETKGPVENNMIMLGDAAGMITPLCGNGMAMAMHSAKIASDVIIANKGGSRESILALYEHRWMKTFASRLAWGRQIQKYLFGKNWASSLAVSIGRKLPAVTNYLIDKTHGKAVT